MLSFGSSPYRHVLSVSANFSVNNPSGLGSTVKPEEKVYTLTVAEDKSRSTILVADDTESILTVVQSILKNEGFRVLVASSGALAIKLAADYPDKIDLLLSDIEMPGMIGPQLGITIKESRPDMHVMLMSGLPGGDLLVLNYGWAFIQKPLIAGKLVEMIAAVLENPNISQGNYGYETMN